MKLIDKDKVVAEIEKLKGKVSDSSSYCNGWQQALSMLEIELNTLETKEMDLEKKKEVIIKGFVAVDNGGDKMTWNPTGRRVAFFPKKPVRDLLTDSHYWAAHISPYDVIHLGYDAFPELKWEDEPIEVKVIVKARKGE